MLQLIILVIISWILLWLFDKSRLSVLGFKLNPSMVKLFIILFLVSSLCSATSFLFKMAFIQQQYVLNDLSFYELVNGVFEQLRSVLTEELICRGALLYILWKKLGSKWAIFISSISFALLHFINIGITHDIVSMTMLFVFTFLMGLLLAYSFIKFQSILIPFAIHFGWNFIQNFVFTDKVDGFHIFSPASPAPEVTVSYFIFFLLIFFPKISVLVANYIIVKKSTIKNIH